MAASVTIDKSYLETLLRRAECHVPGRDLTTSDVPMVSIPKVDHENLLRMAQEYAKLRDALGRGGISSDTIEVLIRGDSILQPMTETLPPDHVRFNGGVSLIGRPNKTAVSFSRASGNEHDHTAGSVWSSKTHPGSGPQKDRGGFYPRKYSFGQDDNSIPSDMEKEDQHSPVARVEHPKYARVEQRTIMARNLSDRASHKDIVDIVRGGALLDLFIRSNERSASISFIDGSAAQNFMNYVKRNDIYIHGKRLEFAWNERQFILPGHVANKIGIGATRNLVIRNIHPNITEERLREDLDHIHNLVIISISFQNGDAYLSLNSTHNALFARSCMMSRAIYKGMKIQWYPDDCAQPLPERYRTPKKDYLPQPAKKPSAPTNRFQMLDMDGTEDGTEDDSDEVWMQPPS